MHVYTHTHTNTHAHTHGWRYRESIGLFSTCFGPFFGEIRRFCGYTGFFCCDTELFGGQLGLFCGDIGLCKKDKDTSLSQRSWSRMSVVGRESCLCVLHLRLCLCAVTNIHKSRGSFMCMPRCIHVCHAVLICVT